MFQLNYGNTLIPFPFTLGQWPNNKKNQRENNEQYLDTFNNLCDIFLNLFEWKGLPETCNARALEQVLLFQGKVLFFRHHDNGAFMHCPFNFDGDQINFYGEWTRYRTNAPGYQQVEYTDENSYVIRNTPTMFPTWMTLDIYARKLFDNARAIDVVQQTMKRPFLIAGTKDLVLTIEKIMAGVEENEWIKILNKEVMDKSAFEFFPIPNNGQNLYALWDNYRNNMSEIYKRIGIRFLTSDKAERLVTKEATGNTNITQANGDMLLDIRQLACKGINEMFGLNISVDYKHDYVRDLDESGGGENADMSSDRE